MYDETIRFTVPVGDRWLHADGTLGEEEGALVCVLLPFPTIKERAEIRRLSHEYAGGVRAWVETEQAIEAMRQRVQEGLSAVPEGEDPPDDLVRHNMVLAELLEVRELIAFQATWEVLWRGGAAAWASIADRRMPAFIADALRSAYERAIEGVLSGNDGSSAG